MLIFQVFYTSPPSPLCCNILYLFPHIKEANISLYLDSHTYFLRFFILISNEDIERNEFVSLLSVLMGLLKREPTLIAFFFEYHTPASNAIEKDNSSDNNNNNNGVKVIILSMIDWWLSKVSNLIVHADSLSSWIYYRLAILILLSSPPYFNTSKTKVIR